MAARPEGDEWILARVQSYDITTGVYTVVDEDDVSKTFEVAEASTQLLDTDRITKGEPVFAVYPVRIRVRVYIHVVVFLLGMRLDELEGEVLWGLSFDSSVDENNPLVRRRSREEEEEWNGCFVLQFYETS